MTQHVDSGVWLKSCKGTRVFLGNTGKHQLETGIRDRGSLEIRQKSESYK